MVDAAKVEVHTPAQPIPGFFASRQGPVPLASRLSPSTAGTFVDRLWLRRRGDISPADFSSYPHGMLDYAGLGIQGERLTELSLEELGNMKVTSVSKEPEQVWKTPAAVYVITQDEIRRFGATCIPEALRPAQGVEVVRVDSDHWAIGIREFGAVLANKLLVLIDGRSVYTPLFGEVYWQVQNIPLEDIQRIEVIRGPGGTIWGANAVDGVINIITKSSKDTHGAMASAGGGNVDEGTCDFRYGGGNGKGLDYRIYGMGFVRGHEFHSDGRNFDDWRMGQGGFRGDWTNNRRDSVTLQGDLYDEGAGEATTFALYSPPSQVEAYGQGKFSGATWWAAGSAY